VTRPVQRAALVGDLGGTHLRLGVHSDGRLVRRTVQRWDASPSLLDTIVDLVGDDRVQHGCLAVAAPVEGPRVSLTNAQVSFCAEELRQALRMTSLRVVNDVQAIARSVVDLRPDDVRSLGGGQVRTDRTVVVVAPGTGLGVAALVPSSHGPLVVAGEGGQAPLPVTCDAIPVVSRLLSLSDHLSAEDLVCGGGLPLLDAVVREVAGRPGDVRRSAAEATQDPQVLDVFVDLLAGVAQSHALTFGARGGVVLSGGFLRHLVPQLEQAGFHARFARHPKMARYLGQIPVVVDVREHPALAGAASFAGEAS
jgi:glucokinase